MVGPRVNRDVDASSAERLFDGIAERRRVMVLNDEAHHVHDEKLKWNQTIERLHDELRATHDRTTPARAWSRSSISPRRRSMRRAASFAMWWSTTRWRRPSPTGSSRRRSSGRSCGAEVELGDTSFQRNRQWLDVAVGRWRVFNESLSPSGKRPVLFVMCENTLAADEAGDYLRQLPDFAGDQLLVIHTNRSGEITKDDLDVARSAAREVDEPDSRIRCIVSVLMLREGWDVRNVCVIVTLRPLTAANKILPEQALGRGLRRMTPPGSGFDERVVVIEHEAFRNLWSAELDGGLVVEKEDADKIESGALTIFADEAKRRFDIVIPQLTRALARSDSALNQLDPGDVPDPKRRLAVPDVQPDEYVQYRGMHLIEKGVIEEYEFRVPYAEDPSGVITYYTRGAAKAGGVDRLSGAFATLAPMVRDYLKERVFERPVELEDKVDPAPPGRERRPGARVGAFRRGNPRAGDHRARADDHRERLSGVRHPAVPLVAPDGRGRAHGLQPDAR